jgi:hypothetical protein
LSIKKNILICNHISGFIATSGEIACREPFGVNTSTSLVFFQAMLRPGAVVVWETIETSVGVVSLFLLCYKKNVATAMAATFNQLISSGQWTRFTTTSITYMYSFQDYMYCSSLR